MKKGPIGPFFCRLRLRRHRPGVLAVAFGGGDDVAGGGTLFHDFGGGVAGLATAYRLASAVPDAPEVLVLEAEDAPGGKVRSAVLGGIELEAGPDSLLA